MPVDLFRRLIQKILSPRVLRFGAVGLSGVVINLAVLGVLSDGMRIHVDVASSIAIEVSIIWNFLLNNAWTFADKNEAAKSGFFARLVRYNVISLIGAVVQFVISLLIREGIMHALHLHEAGLWKYPAQLVGIAIAMAWNFLSNFWWTWAPATPAAVTEPKQP